MIIIKGSARADGGQLASYLLTKGGDTGRGTLLEMRGMAGRDLRAGLRLAEVEAELSRGSKPLWHAQIAPAEGVILTRQQQVMAADALERHLGFGGLPRAIVEHVKDGRPHVHVVWSRFDRETGTLRRDDFSKRKNVNAAAEIAQRLGLEPNRNPFQDQQQERDNLSRKDRRDQSRQADTHAEQQQDQRSHKTRQQRRAEITALWTATDSGQALRAALDDAGYTLARGWRGLVVVDEKGQAHSLARQIDGARANDVRARLADQDPGSILSAKEIKAAMRQAQADRQRETIAAGAHSRTAERRAPASEGAGLAAADAVEATQRPSHAAGAPPLPPKAPRSRPQQDAAVDQAQRETIAAGILAALTANHSTFTRQDLSRLVSKETGGTGADPWIAKAGGLDALDDHARASAETSYAKWADDNAALAERFSLAKYVAYVQGKQAERDAADSEALEKRRQSQAAYDRLMAEVEASPDMIRLGPDHIGRDRFTSRAMLNTELRMDAAGDHLAARQAHRVSAAIREAVPGLDRLGGQQRAAFDHITDAGDLALVVGFAGTGKSYVLGRAREAFEAEGLRVRGAALSGVAADNLQEGAGIPSRTLHSLLHQLDTIEEREAGIAGIDQKLDALREADGSIKGHKRANQREWSYLATKRAGMVADLDAARLTDRDVIVLDEAGMVDSSLMERLLSAADQAGAKVVLVGDQEQLQAVGAGAAFRSLREKHGAIEITEVRRQREAWQREATEEFGRTETKEALSRYHDAGMTHQAGTRDEAKKDLIEGWTEARHRSADDTHIILAYTRADVAELNDQARAAYRQEGKLGQDVTLETAHGDKPFATGDRLYFTKNDMRLAVKNGSLGTIETIDGQHVTVALDGGRSVAFDVKDYNQIAHGYAATVHKSQGVTVDRAHVMASRYMDRHAAYVGMTRHRDQADLYYGADEFKTFDSLARRMSRDGSKDTTLDFLARAVTGQVSEGLRDAVGSFYDKHRPDIERPAWTNPPEPEARRPVERLKSWLEMVRNVATERDAPAASAVRPGSERDHATGPERKEAPVTERKPSTAELMRRAKSAGDQKSGDIYKPDDRLAAWREKHSPADRAAFDERRKQTQATEKLRQELAQKQDLNGPTL